MGECYKKHIATFMIMGNQCARHCRFCNVVHGKPSDIDPKEPRHVAETVKQLSLKHVVVTSVTRDDLSDCGAEHFAETIQEIRYLCPSTTVEVLIPDLKGIKRNLDIVIKANPDVINHNIETAQRLYNTVRPEADYKRSLSVLKYVKDKNPDILSKTGIMVGLGETEEEIYKVMDDALNVKYDILTIGQYLCPTKQHIEVAECVAPEKFERYRQG